MYSKRRCNRERTTTHFIQMKHLIKLILTFWLEKENNPKNSPLAILAPWANILLLARGGFRSYTLSLNTLTHLYSWLHSSTVHITPKSALLQALWIGAHRVTMISPLILLLNIHLKLLFGRGFIFSKEWRDLAARIPLRAKKLQSLNLSTLYRKLTPPSLIKISIIDSLLEGNHRDILWWHCNSSETIHHYWMVYLIKNS